MSRPQWSVVVIRWTVTAALLVAVNPLVAAMHVGPSVTLGFVVRYRLPSGVDMVADLAIVRPELFDRVRVVRMHRWW